MNDLRTAAQQALEAYCLRDYDFGKYMDALRAALAQQAEPKPLHPEVRKMCDEYFDKCVEALLTFPVAPFKAQDPTPPPEDVTEAEKTVYGAALQGGRLPRPEAAWRNVCSDVPQCPALQPTIPALKVALAQEQTKSETCTWWQDGDSDSGTYSTSCRHYFNLEDGTPEDNKLAWCCYCGKKLAQELITEDEDD